LKKQGLTFDHALEGAGDWDYALAAIIWHEMAHINGADEAEAQRQEEQLWRNSWWGDKLMRGKASDISRC
jgi:hypothetical protein